VKTRVSSLTPGLIAAIAAIAAIAVTGALAAGTLNRSRRKPQAPADSTAAIATWCPTTT
jgi:hypothetical protein